MTIEDIIQKFDKHLSESAPSMDKFEKAAALNFLRQSLLEYGESLAKETIICAAVLSTTGKVIRGHRHNNCLATLHDMKLGYEYGDGTTQGFITSKNRYVDRKEAMKIQKAAGIESLDPGGYRGDELYSEDLY